MYVFSIYNSIIRGLWECAWSDIYKPYIIYMDVYI